MQPLLRPHLGRYEEWLPLQVLPQLGCKGGLWTIVFVWTIHSFSSVLANSKGSVLLIADIDTLGHP